MKIEQAQEILENLRYKYGTKFRIRDCENYAAYELMISVQVPHVVTGMMGPIICRNIIYYEMFEKMKEKGFINYVLNQIEGLERHEMHEWFKYKGLNIKRVHDNPTYKFGEEEE